MFIILIELVENDLNRTGIKVKNNAEYLNSVDERHPDIRFSIEPISILPVFILMRKINALQIVKLNKHPSMAQFFQSP